MERAALLPKAKTCYRTAATTGLIVSYQFHEQDEEAVIARMPIMYCRYIDDCCVITSAQQETDVLFEIFDQQSVSQVHKRSFAQRLASCLNTQLKISGRRYVVKWYQKNSSRNILLHAKAAHPEAVKRAVVRNMYSTVTGVCTGELKREEQRMLTCDIGNLMAMGHNTEGQARKLIL
ncbi:unnamed protein product [Haemonchus placei]|uniref:Reverse transcriptase domain-containing protein n=1 Tax=Haemonchus placei TaxID=6290 RepID=A0A0N4X8J8_HAEPC|nr:unnamed protein product [Haemonchus placei]